MDQFVYFIMFALGLVMIIKGSDWFIDAVIWIANIFRIPHIIIGATIVSICTTLPETFVSLTASLKGETDVAFGNAIGSIAVNTGFILAILLIFAKPVIENRKQFYGNGFFLITLLLMTSFIGFTLGELNRWIGLIFIGLLMVYLYDNVRSAKRLMSNSNQEAMVPRGAKINNLFKFAMGLSLVVFGSNLLVDNGIIIAEILGVPSLLIAVTFTALGTSLPELVTAITSIRKKVTNLGVGNIIGADILNIIQVLAVSSIITPIPLDHDRSIIYVQLPFCLLIVVAAILFGSFSKKGFRRWQGVALLFIYSIFLALNLMKENVPILGPLLFGS